MWKVRETKRIGVKTFWELYEIQPGGETTLPDGSVERYPSQAEAGRVLGCAQSGISRACRSAAEYFGRRWAYAD